MNLVNLENLAKTGNIKPEPKDRQEFLGLLHAGKIRLNDAKNEKLSPESRFDLAYNAAHSLALAALRWCEYRPANQRYIVFQAIPHTTGLGPEVWRVLDACHRKRNLSEYEGYFEADEQLMKDLLKAADTLLSYVENLTELSV